MIISRTPYRISFFGGGTDYPAWYRKYGGAVLATTIDKYCYLSCRHLPPFFEHRFRIVYSKVECCASVEEITHPSVREVLRFLKWDRGLEIHHDGDLPARSGMGSSSAFTVGLLNVIYALQGRIPSSQQLAAQSIAIEQERLQEVVGSQDQVMAAYGGFNHVTFPSEGDVIVRPVTLSAQRLRELNAHLMLFYTGIKRTASSVASSYVTDLDSKKQQLRIMKSLVDESLNVLTSGQDIGDFGELLHEAWHTKRSLSPLVTNADVDEIYAQARAAGALGGKITGAGGGGFMLLFVPPERQETVKQALSTLIHVPFNFDHTGSRIIYFEPETDYAVVERDRQNQTIAAFRELLPIEKNKAA